MKDKKAIVIFLLITLIMSGVCSLLIILGGDTAVWLTYVLMWCPGAAALVTQKIFYRHQKILGFNKCKIIYILAAIIIPLIYLGVSYGIYWLIDKDSLNEQVYTVPFFKVLLSLLITFLLSLLPSSLAALGEEIGWRGFLLPKISGIWNVKIAVILSGAIWAIWHFPLILAGLYQTGTPVWYQLPMFTVELIAITGILAFLRIKSDSIWPAVIFHACHNIFDQSIFTPLTTGERRAYYAGETGIITIIALIIVLIFIFAKKKKALRKQE